MKIQAGEYYSTAITESGSLFIWGKNSHLIRPDKPSNAKFWLPFHINKGLGPIQKVFCGSWHAVAITGNPAPFAYHSANSEASEQDFPMASPAEEGEQDTSSDSEGDFSELPRITVKKDSSTNKESTKISIADFYSGQDVYSDEGEAPSPAFFTVCLYV